MSDNPQKEPPVVLCDMCTEEERKPARKTCMKCEISMCVQHLQVHLTTPVLLQTHPLTEPMTLGGATKCPQHGKLLEYYCLDDMTCVCVSCAIEDQHRLHNMKTFSTAQKELMERLNAEQQALLVKSEDEDVSLEKWEKSEREKLERSSVRLIDAVKSLRDISLTSVQSSVSARMVSIKTSKTSMQAAQSEKDTFRFLQMYSQVHQDVEKAKAVDLRKGLEPGSDRDKLVLEIRQNGEKMMKQAGQFWGSLLTLVDPKTHQELVATSPDLIFDQTVFNNIMSLSEDKRKVFYNQWLGQCSATLLIHSTRSVTNFQRWVVSLSQDCDWTIGLCNKQSATNPKSGHVYALCCKGNELSSLATEYDDCSDKPKPQEPGLIKPKGQTRVVSAIIAPEGGKAVPRPEKVEVFWDFAASSVSFFSRIGQYQREEIITIGMGFNSWDLVPFVQLQKENSQNRPQQQVRCLCGKLTDNATGFTFGGSSRQSCSSCGVIIPKSQITEMVCELQ